MLKPIEIGLVNTLPVLKSTEQGLYLGDEVEEILLPNKYIPEGTEVGDELDVFIYTDSEDRMIATNLAPYVQRDQFACLEVKDVSEYGVFLDWGLEKDLMLPYSEQVERMNRGEKYLVYCYLDEVTDRLAATAHLHKYLDKPDGNLQIGQEVDLIIGEEGELGYRCIMDQKYLGLLYKNEVFRKISTGDTAKGYVKKIREDEKIDLSLERTGYAYIDQHVGRVLTKLKESGGYLPYTDKSNPNEIQQCFQMSKKNFKKSIGTLYRQKVIVLESDGIRLNQ